MTRLIDKEDVLEAVKALPVELDAETVQRCIEVLSNQQTVDAVPVIHCRDCKHRMHDKTCIKVMKRKPDNGYCDEGEVREV